MHPIGGVVWGGEGSVSNAAHVRSTHAFEYVVRAIPSRPEPALQMNGFV
uniref:Uncharacterized protein n=1 Tax=Anguilla anguilla TaxID=7936 RepID=A0A0E9R9B4_ANGAN